MDAVCRERAGREASLPGIYIVKPGDTLWGIADRHYGKGARYTRIHRANLKRIPDADVIRPCQRIWIPA